jgi:hypothetical protein
MEERLRSLYLRAFARHIQQPSDLAPPKYAYVVEDMRQADQCFREAEHDPSGQHDVSYNMM